MDANERIDLLMSHALMCVCAATFAGEIDRHRAAAAFQLTPDQFEELLRLAVAAGADYLTAAERGAEALSTLMVGGYLGGRLLHEMKGRAN